MKPMDGMLLEKTLFTSSHWKNTPAFLSEKDNYRKFLTWSQDNPRDFWAQRAERIAWHATPSHVGGPGAWFPGGKLNLAYLVEQRLLEPEYQDQPALVTHPEEPGQATVTTVRELRKRIQSAVSLLLQSGLEPGQRVLLCLPQGPQLVACLLACQHLGLVCVPVDPTLDPSLLILRAQNAQIHGMVLDPNLGEDFKQPLQEALLNVQWVVEDFSKSLEPEIKPEPILVSAMHPACMLENSSSQVFSQPTAGLFLQSDLAWEHLFKGPGEPSSVLLLHPCRHSAFFSVLLSALCRHCCLHLFSNPESASLDRVNQVISEHQLPLVAIWARMLVRWAAAFFDYEKKSQSGCQLMVAESSMLPPQVYQWARRVLLAADGHLTQALSRPECGGYFLGSHPIWDAVYPACSGHALPGFPLLIVDRLQNPQEANRGGLLVLKEASPATALELQEQRPYIPTGILGRSDADSAIWTVDEGPSTDGQESNLPRLPELEARILETPGVNGVVVVRYQDKQAQFYHRAFVQLSESKEQVLSEIRKRLAEHFPHINLALEFQLTEVFPVSRSGKLLRSVMRRVASGELDGLLEHGVASDPQVVQQLILNRKKIH